MTLIMLAAAIPCLAVEDATKDTTSTTPNPVWRFLGDTASDTSSWITAPMRFDATDWTVAGAVTIGIAGAGIAFDDRARSDSQEHRNSFRDRIGDRFNPIGTYQSLAYVAVVMGVGWVANSPTTLQYGRDSLEATIIASGIITPAIKWTAGRTRPDSEDPDRWQPFSGNLSFPSGHTTQAFALASVAAFTFDDQPLVGVFSFGIASMVALSRINGNDHYVSDVLTGATIGTTVGWVVTRRNRERNQPPPPVSIDATAQGVEITVRW